MRAGVAILFLACGLLIGTAATTPQGAAWAVGSIRGIAGAMPAYYDHHLFTINFAPFTVAQATLLAKNGQQNTIYQSDPGLPGGQPFISVIDAIPGDGMNPLWAEVQIAFTAGHTPRQLFSDDEIAAAKASGEITLTPTNEMYRCSVIGAPLPVGAVSSSRPASSARPAAAAANASSTSSGHASATRTWGALKSLYR